MRTLQTFFLNRLLIISLLVSTACSAKSPNEDIILTGSTPGDDEVKSLLHIPATTVVDFIRWDIQLHADNSYVMNVQYGESQPNTLGFKNDGERKLIKGTYSLTKSHPFNEIYHLKSTALSAELLVAKLTNNIFHLLSAQQKLMVGNGGWSYSFNRKVPVADNKIALANFKKDEKQLQGIYEGRTPCQEISGQHPEMNAASSCFKIKWKLVLYRDSTTYQPTTCTIRNIVDNQPRDVNGKWEIIKGIPGNPEAMVYKITVGNLVDPILFLAADNNILLFLDKDKEPLIGNKDFSFTMNKVGSK